MGVHLVGDGRRLGGVGADVDHDVGALGGKAQGDRPSDVASRSGDECHCAGKLAARGSECVASAVILDPP